MKHGYRKLVVGLVAVAVLTSTASGAGFSVNGVGARARAMGGAFRAIADDWSAAYWNPAGLAYVPSTELDVTMLVVNPRPTYTPTVSPNLLGWGFNIKDGGARYPEDHLLPFPTFSGFVRLPSAAGVTFGAAIYWTQDVNTIWDLYKTPDNYNATVNLPKHNYRVDLDVWDFHPTLAKELIKDKLSVGVGVSVQRGDLVFRRMYPFVNPWPADYSDPPFDRLLGTMQFDGSGVGIGGNAGLLYKFNDKITLGLSGQTPVTVKLDGNSDMSIIFPTNRGLQERDTTYSAYFQGGSAADRNPFKMDLELPGSLGLGVAYRPAERWTLAADVAMTFWSRMEEWKFRFADNPMTFHVKGIEPIHEFVMPMNWKDQVQLSLGAQYQIRENLTLRWGYGFDQSAVPDETVSPYFPDYGSRHRLNAGASLRLSHFELSGQISGAFSGKRTISEISDLNRDRQFDNFPGEYKTNQFDVLLSTMYRF